MLVENKFNVFDVLQKKKKMPQENLNLKQNNKHRSERNLRLDHTQTPNNCTADVTDWSPLSTARIRVCGNALKGNNQEINYLGSTREPCHSLGQGQCTMLVYG